MRALEVYYNYYLTVSLPNNGNTTIKACAISYY